MAPNLPRLQLDVLPGLACAAHVALVAKTAPQSIKDYLAAGSAMQRFWLEATRLGLWMQPEMTPVIFSRYHRSGRTFTRSAEAQSLGARLARRFDALVGADCAKSIGFLGRIGSGPAPAARSLRRPLSQLIVAGDSTTPVTERSAPPS